MPQLSRLILLTLSFVLFAGCSSEPPEIVRSRDLLASRMAEDPQYRVYALSVMAGSSAPHAQALTLEAIAGVNRQAAAEAIRGLDGALDAATVGALESVLAAEGSVKILAATVLAEDGHAGAITWLAEQLDGQPLPATALAALAVTEHEDAVEQSLRRLIASDNLSIRNEGYEILGLVRRPWATKLLLEGLDAEFGEERLGPIAGLGRIGDAASSMAIARWVGTQGLVLATLEALGNLEGDVALTTVRTMLDHEEPLVRAYAAVAAWRLGAGDAAQQALAPLLSDELVAVRRTLATQLAAATDEQATRWLKQLAGDAETEVRVEAYRALVARSGAGLADQFATGAQDPNYEVATISLAGLAESGNPSQREPLAAHLESGNPYLEISAAHAILSLAGEQP